MRRSIQVIVLLVILVCAVLYFTGRFGNTFAALVSIAFSLTVVLVAILIFLENRHPASTVAWLAVLAFAPIVGFVFYVLFGQNYRKRRIFENKAERDAKAYALLEHRLPPPDEELSGFGESQRKLFQLARRVARSPISFATKTKILTNGDETFAAILQELKKATRHIHMEYYIYRHDKIGSQIKDILIEKAKAGVEVRFLYDAVGSLQLPRSFIHEMRKAGVQAVPFSPVSFPLLSNKINYRNHRKIIVIDGNVGFVGGLNVGDEYLGHSKTYGFWRDTHMLVRGEAVHTLQIIFLQDWAYMTGEERLSAEYFPAPLEEEGGDGAVQIIASGPDSKWETMKQMFFSMITSARRSIWIATPYFIPDEDIFSSLQVAALSGIDVRILFPKKPDKKLPFLASHSYFPALLEAGVQIYEYEKGFMHAKILIVDGTMASIGSANMDMRSLHLNFEVNAFLYRTESTQKLVADFEADLRDASRIDREQFAQRKWVERVLESAARLLSPLL